MDVGACCALTFVSSCSTTLRRTPRKEVLEEDVVGEERHPADERSALRPQSRGEL
jgi:hypothetical protein